MALCSKVGVGEGSQQRREASRAVSHGGSALGGEGMAGYTLEKTSQLLTGTLQQAPSLVTLVPEKRRV